ncbi:hypothetical protein [Ruminococcus champanellensis]|uniref:Uncharacterized protein n=1 Tax=Ruminococcus champanellensis (strain DSM 18848 / JCM 17042 / KCTC 15320 / 18P13) TaxID=213810 RepID=D4LAE9_RUMC1|nr:hypothetical protein [Ruminococcus champanellensis]CBL16594.1 hypothetical protein RUM_03550 [Ruminococcus champanellensis 18P13 = JCM 17042]
MNDHEKKGKVGGSVLFTVIVVMMVLVVFLMGTLGLASAANKRAQNSYTSSQAQYTARMAVESVLAAMQNDADVAERVYKLRANTPINVDISTDRLATAGTTGDAYGRIQSCTIENIGKDYYYVDDKWDGRDIIKITATVQLGTQDSTVSAYILKKEKDSVVNNTPSGGGGGLVTAGDATFGTKVSVFGGAGINLGNRWRNLDPADALRGYSFDGSANFSSQDTTSLQWEAPYVVNGSFTADGSGAALVFPKLGSGFTFWGNFNFNNQIAITSGNPAVLNAGSSAALNYTDIPYIYVEKTLSITNGAKGVNVNHQIPLNILCGNTCIITTDPIYANLYMMNDNTPDSEKVEKQVYWPEFKIEKYANYINFNQGSLLSNWTYQLINGVDNPTEHVGGSIYAQDDLCIDADNNRGVVEGSLVVDDDLLISTQEFVVEGDLVVKGRLKITNGRVKVGGKFYHDDQAGDDYTDKVFDSTGATALTPDAYDSNLGYPYYMDREYVLGLTDETYTGKDASGKNVTLARQFVNTLQDTMSTAMDPYKNAYYGLPTTAYGGKVDSWWQRYSVDPTSAAGMDVRAYEPNDAVNTPNGKEIVIANTEIAVLRSGNYDGVNIRVVPDDSHPSIWLIVDDNVSFGNMNGYRGFIFEDCGATVAEITNGTDVKLNKDGNPAYQVVSTGTYADYVKKDVADANGEFQGKYSLNMLLRGSVRMNKAGLMTRHYVSLAETGTNFQIYNAYGKPDTGIYKAERPNVYVYSANYNGCDLSKDPTDPDVKDTLDKIEAQTGYRPTTKNSCPYLNVTTKDGYNMPKVNFEASAAFLSAYFMAPFLDIDAKKVDKTFGSCTVYYNGHQVKSNAIGIIGTMIGNGVNAGSDGAWVSLYYPSYIPPVTPPDAPEDETYMNSWALIQFENY